MAKVAIFIDVPNVTRGNVLRLNQEHWKRLSVDIADKLSEDDQIVWAKAYCFCRESTTATETEQIRLGLAALFDNEFDPVVRPEKDVDDWISADMLAACLREVNALVNRADEGQSVRFPVKMRLILVSGDHGYARALRDLKAHAGEIIDFTLEVWSWQKALSPQLMCHVAGGGLHRLERLFPFMGEEARAT